MQSNFKFGIAAIFGGLLLSIIASQLTIFMKNVIEEMDYRETCARHASQPNSSSSDEEAIKKLGLVKGYSVSRFCRHYK